jgi:N-acetylglutamate synthase-like GNAT family acetyltransferase
MIADFAAQIAAGEVYIAKDDHDAFQGFVVFYAEEGRILLENVTVFPRAAGRGVGKTLIGFCEKVARQRDMTAVHHAWINTSRYSQLRPPPAG